MADGESNEQSSKTLSDLEQRLIDTAWRAADRSDELLTVDLTLASNYAATARVLTEAVATLRSSY